jgi:two-component system, OmpR family, phosphate regulon sensor histidine kinase PhoR
VDDLMSLSRIEMNEHVRPVELVDFNKIGREVCSALLPVASADEMLIDCRIPSDGPPQMVRGEHDQLSQVLSNIIDNAIKYGQEGQTVVVEVAEPSNLHPSQYGISIIDNGPGIPREHIHRLTERFYRVNVNTSRAKGGTGLGLAIVKHILNRHGGALDVESTLGKGSKFTVWLPRAGSGDSRKKISPTGDQVPESA